jgi:hypothetical protein
VQDIGSVVTKEDLGIAFPNLYQHQVSPFELADPAKPGYRKILVFFLVDPNVKVVSATDVAPQQRSWVGRAMGETPATPLSRELPAETIDLSPSHTSKMTEEDAKAYHLELMEERTVFVDVVDRERSGQEFNMWQVPLI